MKIKFETHVSCIAKWQGYSISIPPTIKDTEETLAEKARYKFLHGIAEKDVKKFIEENT